MSEDSVGETYHCGHCLEPVTLSWEGDDCPSCGNELLRRDTDKRFVLDCEECQKTWESNFRAWNALRQTLHALRHHPEVVENYDG